MTAYKDMNTRRLKRAYWRAVKSVWFWEGVTRSKSGTPFSDGADLASAVSDLEHVKKLLKERGWRA